MNRANARTPRRTKSQRGAQLSTGKGTQNLYQNHAQECSLCQTYTNTSMCVRRGGACSTKTGGSSWCVFLGSWCCGAKWEMNALCLPTGGTASACRCRLSSSDLGISCQGLSGSFHPFSLSRYSLSAGQLTVASGWGLLSEKCVRGH